jgi:hypothetical protein
MVVSLLLALFLATPARIYELVSGSWFASSPSNLRLIGFWLTG